jgi:hypothetical protein
MGRCHVPFTSGGAYRARATTYYIFFARLAKSLFFSLVDHHLRLRDDSGCSSRHMDDGKSIREMFQKDRQLAECCGTDK